MKYEIDQYVRRISGVPERYKSLLINTLPMLNEEQEGLREDFRQMWRWDLIEKADDLYASDVSNKQEAFEIIKAEYRSKHPWSVSVIGTVGNGKTTLACAMVNLFNAMHDRFAFYKTQSSLIEEYKDGFDKKVLDRYNTCELLVIDELNPKEKDWTDFCRGTVQKILVERYANNRRTVIIGNLSAEQFKGMFEPHILSRLREGLTRTMTGADLRRNYNGRH